MLCLDFLVTGLCKVRSTSIALSSDCCLSRRVWPARVDALIATGWHISTKRWEENVRPEVNSRSDHCYQTLFSSELLPLFLSVLAELESPHLNCFILISKAEHLCSHGTVGKLFDCLFKPSHCCPSTGHLGELNKLGDLENLRPYFSKGLRAQFFKSIPSSYITELGCVAFMLIKRDTGM